MYKPKSRNITNRQQLSSETIISKVRGFIYNSLWHYWHDLENIRLMATLLNPRLKSMKTWSGEIRNETINNLRDEFKIWQDMVMANESVENTREEFCKFIHAFLYEKDI